MNVSRAFQYPLFVFVGVTDKNMRFYAMMIKISVLRGIKLFYDIFFYKDSLFGEFGLYFDRMLYNTKGSLAAFLCILFFYGLLSDFVL